MAITIPTADPRESGSPFMPELRAALKSVNDVFIGAAPIGSGANFNEPAQYNFGETAAVFRGADGTHSVPVVPAHPGVVFQFFRKDASSIGVQLGFYQLGVLNTATDFYGLYQYSKFGADLAACSGKSYQNHGLRSFLTIDPANVGDNLVYGYSGWFEVTKSVPGARIVGIQVEANNSSGADDLVNLTSGIQSSAALVFSSIGNAHSSTNIFFEGINPSNAVYTGIQIQPDALVRHIIDASLTVFHLQGTVTATEGSAILTGVGTKFMTELAKGDQVLFLGTWFTIASNPASNTSATMTSIFGGSTQGFTSVLKTVCPLRMIGASYITSTDALTGLEEYRLLGLNSSNQVSIDPDGKTAAFGGNATISGAGIRAVVVASTTTGSANSAEVQIKRGDAANGYAQTLYYSGSVSQWLTGLRAPDGSYHIFQTGSGPTNLDRLIIDTSGNVGIGTSTISARLHSFSTTEQLRLGYDASNFASFIVGSGGNLDITPTGDIVFNPGGKDLLPNTAYDLNIGAVNKKYLTLHAAELHVETLVAAETMTMINGRAVVGSNATVLIADLASGATEIDVKHNGIVNGDILWMEDIGQVEFMAAASGPTTITGGFRYTVTRNLDGTGANQWFAGDSVTNLGTTGSGWIDIYSIRSMKSATQVGPTIVGNVRNSTTFNDWSEHWAIGNLNGLYGYGVTTFGVAFGKYAAGATHITIDATNGYRIFKDTATVIGQWDNSGVITVGEVAASKSNVLISAGALSLRNNTTERIGLSAAGILTIKDSAGAAVMTFDASAGAEITKKLTMPGANSAIAIGSTPPTSASVGTGLWIDRTGQYGLLSDVVQAKFDAATGKITAGAGAVTFDVNGITIAPGITAPNLIKWGASDYIGGVAGWIAIQSHGDATNSGKITFHTTSNSESRAVNLDLTTSDSASDARLYEPGGLSFGFTVGADAAPATSAILDLNTTTGALLVTRLTTTQKNALTPTNGMIAYDSTLAVLQGYIAGAWTSLGGGVSGANTALSNLSAVAINTSLTPGTSGAIALGSTTKQWTHLYLSLGGRINFDNGDTVITHDEHQLTIDFARIIIPTAPPASSNYGLLNLGLGPFDGSSSGFFTGLAAGTHLAVNAASGSTADLVHLQVAGVPKFKIGANGSTLFQNLVRVQGALDVPAGASGAGFEMFAAAAGHSVFQSFNRTTSALAPLHLYSTTILISNAVGTPTAFAILDLQSTTSAFMPPRMTTTQRDAMTASDGMILYNTTLATLQYRKAGAWVSI